MGGLRDSAHVPWHLLHSASDKNVHATKNHPLIFFFVVVLQVTVAFGGKPEKPFRIKRGVLNAITFLSAACFAVILID